MGAVSPAPPLQGSVLTKGSYVLPRPSPLWDGLLAGTGAELPSNAGSAANRATSHPAAFP